MKVWVVNCHNAEYGETIIKLFSTFEKGKNHALEFHQKNNVAGYNISEEDDFEVTVTHNSVYIEPLNDYGTLIEVYEQEVE